MEKFIKKGQIIVGLDFDNSRSAIEITKLLNPENYKVKVGNQLFTACGPNILEDLKDDIDRTFRDISYGIDEIGSFIGQWFDDLLEEHLD